MAADADVADMYEQYEQLIENFKAVHKECEAVKSSGYREGDTYTLIMVYKRRLITYKTH